MKHYETPQEVFVVTGDLGQPDDSVAVPYAPSYLEAQKTPQNPMDFPTLHMYGVAPAYEQVELEDEGYGLDLSGYTPNSTPTSADNQPVWTEPVYGGEAHSYAQSFADNTFAEGPEYLDEPGPGADYTFTGPATPEQAVADFKAWIAEHPDSTPANLAHQERLAALYDTLDHRGHVAAAVAIKAARRAREDRAAAAAAMASPEADPTRTSVIKVADVLGEIAAQRLTNEDDQVHAEPAAAAPEQPATQPAPRHAANRGRHRRR